MQARSNAMNQQVGYQQQMSNQSNQSSLSNQSIPNQSYQDFFTRMQNMSSERMIYLLWQQRVTISQLQQKSSYLEKQLMMVQNNMSMNGMMPNSQSNMPYYQPGPNANGVGPYNQGGAYGNQIPTTTSNEAELQRANMRMNSRMMNMQTQQQSSGSNVSNQGSMGSQDPRQSNYRSLQSGQASSAPSVSTPNRDFPNGPSRVDVGNMQQAIGSPYAEYWRRIFMLKEKYSNYLITAYQVISQAANSGSGQAIKAESVKQNIHFAMCVLNENPTTHKPRVKDVIDSVEKFIHSTIIPLAQKIQMVRTNTGENSSNSAQYNGDSTTVPSTGMDSTSAQQNSGSQNTIAQNSTIQSSAPTKDKIDGNRNIRSSSENLNTTCADDQPNQNTTPTTTSSHVASSQSNSSEYSANKSNNNNYNPPSTDTATVNKCEKENENSNLDDFADFPELADLDDKLDDDDVDDDRNGPTTSLSYDRDSNNNSSHSTKRTITEI